MAAPLLLQLGGVPAAAAAEPEPGPRYLTAEQQKALDAAFAATFAKSKVGWSCMCLCGAGAAGALVPAPAAGLAPDSARCFPLHCPPRLQAPVMLRLVFHDAGSYSAAARDGGVNGSIQFELERPDNFGLKRGW